ncbi:MAG: IS1595 family transposase [Proteobacteria bacterium]|nr:IS1595 family transposase [Pseudomonadota bacterium]
MTSVLSAPHFHDEDAAYEYVESHLWPTGPVCPHCGNADAQRIGRLLGKTTRAGLRKCYACRKPFTVKMGTIFEDSHAPLRLWLQAIYLLCSCKKGISTRQLQRTLGVGMKTAWFMGHRIRHAMAPGSDQSGPLGGAGKIVEADETYLTKSPKTRKPAGHIPHQRHAVQVVTLVERGGKIRSQAVHHGNVRAVVRKHMHEDSKLVTDKSQVYIGVARDHESVDHSKYEWKRDEAHTNTLEGFFSVFKRGLVGTYQHMDKRHLDRYLAEFDFRQNTRAKVGFDDEMRTAEAVKGFKGKRLTYETTAG